MELTFPQRREDVNTLKDHYGGGEVCEHSNRDVPVNIVCIYSFVERKECENKNLQRRHYDTAFHNFLSLQNVH